MMKTKNNDVLLKMVASFLMDLNLSPIPKPAERLVLVVGISYEILSIVFFTLGNLLSCPNDHYDLAGDVFKVS